MKENIIKLKDGIMMEAHPDHIGKAIRTMGDYYEKAMLDYIRKLSERRPMETILDVGANIGNHSVFFAKYCAKYVYAVEPVPQNFELLLRNRDRNGLDGIMAFNFGLGKTEGSARFKVKEGNMGACDLIRGDGGISIITPDRFLDREYGLIKIDCESMSGEVFESLLPIIKRDRPHIFIEASPYEADKYAKMVGGKLGMRFNATPTWHIFFR